MTAVVRLFFGGSPAAIPRGVGAIIVDAIKLMLRSRFASHISEKRGVVGELKFDSAASVIFPVFVLWIVAPFARARPTFPFRAAIITVFGILLANGCIFGATTRLDAAILKIATGDGVLFSTIALTEPVRVSVFGMRQRNDCQEAKTLTCQVLDASSIFSSSFSSKAPTGLDSASFKLVGSDDLFGSAIALTKPSCYVILIDAMKGDCRQTSEFLVGQVVSAEFLHWKKVSQTEGIV